LRLKKNNKQAAIDAVLVSVWIGKRAINLLPIFIYLELRHEIDVWK